MIGHTTAAVDPHVRRLCEADHAAVEALAAGLRRWFGPRDLHAINTLLHDEPSGWVAFASDGTLTGFLLDAPTADPTTREVAWMGVVEDRQGQGIGSLLLGTVAAEVRATGMATLEVSTVAESAGYAPYAATRTFYYHHGFEDVRVDHDYYWPGGDRLVLRRGLAPRPASPSVHSSTDATPPAPTQPPRA